MKEKAMKKTINMKIKITLLHKRAKEKIKK